MLFLLVMESNMQVDRILYPVSSLGPGQRIVVWLIGCKHNCFGCSNPELWDEDQEKEFSVEQLVSLIFGHFQDKQVEGLTITGGEPFDQYPELIEFIKRVRTLTNDILVYTGYTLIELEKKIESEGIDYFKQNISVLIDGRYIHSLNDSYSALRGSTNQIIHFFDHNVQEKYEQYLKEGRILNNFTYGNNLITVGIINKEKI
jgi:anaerobic ribonucleoside-triphosphate reductase activating protein